MITLEYVLSFSMSIPDFQSIMLPLLELASDGREHKLSETITHLATHFNLTDTERMVLSWHGEDESVVRQRAKRVQGKDANRKLR